MRLALLALAGLAVALAGPAYARKQRSERSLYDINEALATPEARAKVTAEVRLFFGDQRYPALLRTIGTWTTGKKTDSSGLSDKDACQAAFLRAVLQLQHRALGEGGDAVVDIYSNNENVPTSSPTHFMCGTGPSSAVVALKGTVVRLSGR